jgi:hypothetical protein
MKTVVRSIMVNCACGKHQIVSGYSTNGIEQEAKVKAQERAAEKGWTFSVDKVRCPECSKQG